MALARIGSPAVPPLIEMLETNNDRNARWGAANALRMTYDQGNELVREQVLQAMVRALKEDEFADVREMAARLIGRAGPPSDGEAYPTLLESVEDDDAGVRGAAAVALAKLGPPPDVTLVLAGMLEDKRVAPRAGALRGLAMLGPEAKLAIPVVEKALADPNRRVRILAAVALWKIDSQAGTALPVLIEVLQDRKTPDRYSQDLLLAISTLSSFGPEAKAALPALIELLETKLNTGPLIRTRNAIKIIDTEAAARVGLVGHAARVTSVAFSPDGTRLASSAADKMIMIWDVSTGEQLITIRGHAQGVTSVAFSPDGARLASASMDKTIRLWNASTGEHLETIRGHDEPVISITFSPRGEQLASSSRSTVRLWSASTAEPVATLHGHESEIVTSIAFSPDGAWIASGSHDATIRAWEASTGKQLNATIRIWDASTGKQLNMFRSRQESVSSVAFFPPGGHRLATGSMDRTIMIWDTTSGEEVAELRGGGRWRGSPIQCICLSPDGSRIAAGCSVDNKIRIWDTTTGEELLAR